MRSIARLRAVVTIQARRVRRHAVARPALERDRERVLHRVLGEVEVAEDADEVARTAPDSSRKSARRRRRAGAPAPVASAIAIDGPDLDRAVACADGILRGPLERLVEVVALDEVEAAELLLRLGERAVGDERSPSRTRTVVAVCDRLRAASPAT